jgi:o-succinylbenzoate synthase
MTIHVHRYTLRTGAALNAVSVRRQFDGALLRVNDGFAALHPWPEFGDAPVEQQLRTLRDGGSTPLLERTLHIAAVDGAARREGRSLFDGLKVPRSHYSWSAAQTTQVQLEYLRERGFHMIKAKGYASYGETRSFLDGVTRAAPELRLRVDFNGCLEPAIFAKFIEFMPLKVYRALDVIEDPTPYDPAVWQAFRERWGVKLALDKGWREAQGGFDAVVIKPARRDWREVHARHPESPMIITSAMDHALGQSYAAYEGALAALAHPDLISDCGLCTQHLFERDPFFARLEVEQGVLQVDRTGTGLGFDDLLQSLLWTPLDEL